jgi:haloacetate dehalogenase
MQRRTFLAAASAGSLVRLANAQNSAGEIDVAGNKVFYRRYGQGPAILMLHGFPRTSLMWRFLAPKLPGNHTVVCADLRAYGRSGILASTDDHFPYSSAQWRRSWLT